MKTLFSVGAMFAFLGCAVVSTFAQTQSTTSSSTTYIQTSKLVGTKVKSTQGEEIGVVKDVVLDCNTGCMADTVLSTGGGGAHVSGGGKLVTVPWAVYSPTSDLSELTVTVDPERIYNAPYSIMLGSRSIRDLNTLEMSIAITVSVLARQLVLASPARRLPAPTQQRAQPQMLRHEAWLFFAP